MYVRHTHTKHTTICIAHLHAHTHTRTHTTHVRAYTYIHTHARTCTHTHRACQANQSLWIAFQLDQLLAAQAALSSTDSSFRSFNLTSLLERFTDVSATMYAYNTNLGQLLWSCILPPMCLCVRVCVCVRMCKHTRTRMCVCVVRVSAHACVCGACECARMCVCAYYVYVCTYVCVPVCTDMGVYVY